MKWEERGISSDGIHTAADKILNRDLRGTTAIWLAIKTTWAIWNSANWDEKDDEAWQTTEGRQWESQGKAESMWSRISLHYISFITSHFSLHENIMPRLPSCTSHLIVCCFSDWIVLLCCTALLHWPRLSNCTSISTEMKKWNEQRAFFPTQIHFLSAQNGMSLSHRKCNHTKEKWPTLAPGWCWSQGEGR